MHTSVMYIVYIYIYIIYHTSYAFILTQKPGFNRTGQTADIHKKTYSKMFKIIKLFYSEIPPTTVSNYSNLTYFIDVIIVCTVATRRYKN